MPLFNRMIPVAPFFQETLSTFSGISMGTLRSGNAPLCLYRSLMSLLYTKTIILFIKNSGSVDARPGRLKTFKMQGSKAIMDKISDKVLFG